VTKLVTGWSTFIIQGGWMGQRKGVVSSFRLELDKLGSWRFIEIKG
jgi:hypothetical protein